MIIDYLHFVLSQMIYCSVLIVTKLYWLTWLLVLHCILWLDVSSIFQAVQ